MHHKHEHKPEHETPPFGLEVGGWLPICNAPLNTPVLFSRWRPAEGWCAPRQGKLEVRDGKLLAITARGKAVFFDATHYCLIELPDDPREHELRRLARELNAVACDLNHPYAHRKSD